MRTVLLPFLVTRLGLLLVGWLAIRLLGVAGPAESALGIPAHQSAEWLDLWARWDSGWYLLIAEEGYDGLLARDVPAPFRPTDTIGFFPLYPMLIRTLAAFGPSPLLAGIIISNLASVLSLVLLAALVRRDYDDSTARRAIWALMVFPSSLFFSAVYAESLLMMSAAGAILMARERRFLAAGLLGALCTLSRPVGMLILIPLASELIACSQEEDLPRSRRVTELAGCLLPPAIALSGFLLYGLTLTGSFSAVMERQIRWRGMPSGPWRALLRYFEAPALHDAHHSTLDLAIALLMLTAIPLLFRLLPRSYALYGTAMILAPLGTTLWSFSRLAAVIFPVHVALAVATRGRRGWFAAYLAAAIPLAAILMSLYATWRWAG